MVSDRNASLGSTCHKGIGIGDRASEGDLGFRIGIDFFFCWDRGLGCTFFVLGGIEFGVVDRVVDHL